MSHVIPVIKQWWKVSKNIYSSTVLEVSFEVLVLYITISVIILCLYSTTLTLKKEVLYYLLHYIYLTTVVTFQIKIHHKKKCMIHLLSKIHC